jgi:uncharacterized protein
VKIVIPGGNGQIGTLLARSFLADGHEVITLGRSPRSDAIRGVTWDASTPGDWTGELEGADAVINLAGRNVNCRYTPENRNEILSSRVNSTRVIGQAIQGLSTPPRVWLQASTATIYAHRYDRPNTEKAGEIGGNEPDAPASWAFSVRVAQAWENELEQATTPDTRKIALRTSLVMSPDRNGIFDTLLKLVRFGLGGPSGDGQQFVSWVHDHDFVRAVRFLLEQSSLSGPINVTAPNPEPNAAFMRHLREAWGTSFGLPASAWMLEIGAFALQSETELILKSRRVAPERLLEAGFEFEYAEWSDAARNLTARWRSGG